MTAADKNKLLGGSEHTSGQEKRRERKKKKKEREKCELGDTSQPVAETTGGGGDMDD